MPEGVNADILVASRKVIRQVGALATRVKDDVAGNAGNGRPFPEQPVVVEPQRSRPQGMWHLANTGFCHTPYQSQVARWTHLGKQRLWLPTNDNDLIEWVGKVILY